MKIGVKQIDQTCMMVYMYRVNLVKNKSNCTCIDPAVSDRV